MAQGWTAWQPICTSQYWCPSHTGNPGCWQILPRPAPNKRPRKGILGHEVKGQAVQKGRANHCVARCKQTAYCSLSRRKKSTVVGEADNPAGLPSHGSPSAIRMTRKIQKKTEDRDSLRERQQEREVCGCQNRGHVPVWKKWIQGRGDGYLACLAVSEWTSLNQKSLINSLTTFNVVRARKQPDRALKSLQLLRFMHCIPTASL